MPKICFILLFVLLFNPFLLFSQEGEFVPSGKGFATIYANFHRGITGTATDEAAFELERGYLGYEYWISPGYYARINVDVGSPDDLSAYSKLRRYAYFKNAYIRYSKNNFSAEFGLIGLKQFSLQEQIWERRYLKKTLADEYKLGSSADLGAMACYRFNNTFSADFTMMNGEGYSSLQMDDIFKYGLGVTAAISKQLTARAYYDFTYDRKLQSTLHAFASLNLDKLNLSGEYILRLNDSFNEGHSIYAASVFGKYNLSPKYQLFLRFDRITSNIPANETVPWNLASDGSAIIGGLQFAPVKNIKFALNYQDWYPWAANMEGKSYIYLNLEVKM